VIKAKKRLFPVLLLCFLALSAILVGRLHASLITAQLPNSEWVVNNTYRVLVSVDPGPTKRHQTPVAVEIDFDAIFKAQGIQARLDKNSIRVVRFDPASGRALPYQAASLSYDVPYQLSRDFNYQDAGKIWWRIRDEHDIHFHIYFDALASHAKVEPKTVALIGCGDNILFNNGEPGPLAVSMSAFAYYIDWDGDGRKDLLFGCGGGKEYGMRADRGFIYFFKNVGTSQSPLFAPGYYLKDETGNYLQTVSGAYIQFEVSDWDRDGDQDVLLFSSEKVYLVENTGRRDRDGLPIIKPPREIFALGSHNDFSEDYSFRFPRLVDWNDDGRLDILYSVLRQHMDPKCDPTRSVCYWDEVLQFFQIYQNTGRKQGDRSIFSAPEVVKTARGVLLKTFGYQGADYADWDSDGKSDLIACDMQNHPQGACRVLFYKNNGSAAEPRFLLPITIVPREEDLGDAKPLVLDWNGDGRKDLFLSGGLAKIYINTNPDTKGFPYLDAGRFVLQTHPKIVRGTCTAVADWNGDGLLDLIQGQR
jgi:hypothetical protein